MEEITTVLEKAFGENAPIMYALIGAFLIALISGLKQSVEYKLSPSVRDWFAYVSVVGKICASMFILGAGAAVFWGPSSVVWTVGGAFVVMLAICVPAIFKYKADVDAGRVLPESTEG